MIANAMMYEMRPDEGEPSLLARIGAILVSAFVVSGQIQSPLLFTLQGGYIEVGDYRKDMDYYTNRPSQRQLPAFSPPFIVSIEYPEGK